MWIPICKLADMQVGIPYQFSFTRIQVNGWERNFTSHGGFVLRKSEDPANMIISEQSLYTPWVYRELGGPYAQAYICPCHDGKFSPDGKVLGGPPPRPLDVYTDFRVTQDGILEIFYKGA